MTIRIRTRLGAHIASISMLALLSAGLRFFALDRQSMWFDEGLSIAIAKYPIADVVRSPLSVDPPLYYVVLHYWIKLTSTDWGIRALSALFGVASVIALYWLGRQLLNHTAGLTSALIMAVSPFQLYYAQEARMYTLVTLTVTLCLIAYVRAVRVGRILDWLLFVIAASAAVYTHTYALLALFALDLAWLYQSIRKRDVSPSLPLANVALFLVFLPWLPLLYQKINLLAPDLWLPTPTPLNILTSLYMFLVSFTVGSTLFPIALFLVSCLICLVLWNAIRRPPSSPGEHDALLLVVFLAFVPLVTIFAVSQYRPVYLDRLLIVSTPGYYLLLAWGMTLSGTHRVVRVIALPVLAAMSVSLAHYYTDPAYGKPPIRDVSMYLEQVVSPGDMVAHTSASTYLVSERYLGAARGFLLVTSPDAWLSLPDAHGKKLVEHEPEDALAAPYQKAWLIVALDHNVESQREVKEWFDERFVLEEERGIGGIGVYRYRLNGVSLR